MTTKLTEQPKGLKTGLLGIPYRLPHYPIEFDNDQSLAPDLLRQNAQDRAWPVSYTHLTLPTKA